MLLINFPFRAREREIERQKVSGNANINFYASMYFSKYDYFKIIQTITKAIA